MTSINDHVFNVVRVKTKKHTYYVPFIDPVHGDLDAVCYSFVQKGEFHIADELTSINGNEFAKLAPIDKATSALLKSGPEPWRGFFIAYVLPLEANDA